jgi:hypothetical protein
MTMNLSKSRRAAAMATTVLLGLGLGSGPTGSSAAPLSVPGVPGLGPATPWVVTLITGDRVELNGAGIRPRITPAAGRASMPFRVLTDTDHVRDWQSFGPLGLTPPLLGVIYRPDLDDHHHAKAGAINIPVELFRQPGADTATVATVTVDVSYDDGLTWHTAPLTWDGQRWSAAVDNPAGGSVSLRVQAEDTDGNGLKQTTIRAYLIDGKTAGL